MSQTPLGDLGLDRAESGDDVAVPFTLDELNCRGRSIRLADALHEIIIRHNYPAPVARLLGEAVLLASLVGSSLKFEGRFILQSQTDGPVNMIVVDLDAPDGLRGYARFDEEALQRAIEKKTVDSATLLGKGHLAMTVDQGSHTERYQGIVEIDGSGFETAAHHYFGKSEQILTAVRLAVAEQVIKGSEGTRWRAGGMMVQYLPEVVQNQIRDLPGGDDPQVQAGTTYDPDNWVEAQSLFSTITDDELVDPRLSVERLLFRLFNEKGVRVFEPKKMVARCTCSAERTEAMLAANFSTEDRLEMAVDGEIEVVCEFCSATYHFNPSQFEI
jgi:molecular chaperone Hsp33